METANTSPQPNSCERFKVAIVAPSFKFVGGHAVQAELLLRLWNGDPAVETIFVPIDPPLPKWSNWAKQIRGLRTLLREPLYMLLLWRALGNMNIAHIFASSYWSFLISAAPAWLVAKLRGCKILIHYHSGDARDHLQRFRSARFFLSRAEQVVVPTRYLVDVFHEFGLSAISIPNVLDLEQFRYRIRIPLRPHLICPRGFSTYYNVDVVVRAYAEVKRAYPDARLDLVGEGPLEHDIRKLVNNLKLTDVSFTGVISRREIGKCYDRADIFINASSVDAMPVSVMEAFRAGLPVVSTAPEAMPYLVNDEHTGLLSAVGDERALAANVMRLLRDPQLGLTIAENAYRESRKFEWALIREQWLCLYREMLNFVARGIAGNGAGALMFREKTRCSNRTG